MKPTQEQVIAWAREARFYEGEIADDLEWFTVLATLAYEAGRKDTIMDKLNRAAEMNGEEL